MIVLSRLFDWRVKSRPGRPPIPLELRQLIRRMASENPVWGDERIAVCARSVLGGLHHECLLAPASA